MGMKKCKTCLGTGKISKDGVAVCCSNCRGVGRVSSGKEKGRL